MKMLQKVLICLMVVALAGCGGGGDGSPNPPVAKKYVTGTVSKGAAVSGASVVLVDSLGASTAPVLSDANGDYQADVTGFTPPFVVKATYVDGTQVSVYSVAANSGVIANVNPITDIVVKISAPNYTVGAIDGTLVTAVNNSALENYNNLIGSLYFATKAYGVNQPYNNLITEVYAGNPFDKLFDVVSYDLNTADKSLKVISRVSGGVVATIPDISAISSTPVKVDVTEVYNLATGVTIDSLSVSSGDIGSKFVIEGKGLLLFNRVLINGVAASYSGYTTTSGLEIFVGPKNTTGTITLVDTINKTYYVTDKIFTVTNYDGNINCLIKSVIFYSGGLDIRGGNFEEGSTVVFKQGASSVVVTPSVVYGGAVHAAIPNGINIVNEYTIQIIGPASGKSNSYTVSGGTSIPL